MLIRCFETSDLEDCSKLYAEVFSKDPWNEKWDFKIAEKRLSHFLNSEGFVGILAHEKSSVVGFVIGNIEPFLEGNIFYLREMCVHPDYQNGGVGSKIISKTEEVLTELNIKSIYLFTDRKIPAAYFYKKHGYRHDKDLTIFTKDISFHVIGKRLLK